jgi:hypothetical protein
MYRIYKIVLRVWCFRTKHQTSNPLRGGHGIDIDQLRCRTWCDSMSWTVHKIAGGDGTFAAASLRRRSGQAGRRKHFLTIRSILLILSNFFLSLTIEW